MEAMVSPISQIFPEERYSFHAYSAPVRLNLKQIREQFASELIERYSPDCLIYHRQHNQKMYPHLRSGLHARRHKSRQRDGRRGAPQRQGVHNRPGCRSVPPYLRSPSHFAILFLVMKYDARTNRPAGTMIC